MIHNTIFFKFRSAELVSHRICRPWLHIPAIFTAYKYFKGYKDIFQLVHEYPLEVRLNNKITSRPEKKAQFMFKYFYASYY